MADVITIGGVDRSSAVHWDALKIEQVAGQYTAVCSLTLNDATPAIAIAAKDDITVVDNVAVETLFAGEVADVDWVLLSLALDGRRIPLKCQDYGILVEETVIDSEEAYTTTSDSDILDDLFTTYRPDIDATAHVSTIDASMDITFYNITLREALDQICKLTGGYWYIDADKELHYFTAEANVAAWFLSDTPDLANSFPYQDISRKVAGGTIVNQVLVVGSDGVSEWREDAGSVASYGERQAVVVDTQITTAAEAQDRGDAILAKWSEPRTVYKVTTRKTGLRAGMDVRLVCGAWTIDETLTIRRLTIYWKGGERFYDLELGDVFPTQPGGGNTYSDRIKRIEIDTGDLNDTVFDDDPPGAPAFNAGNLSTGTVINNDGTELVYIVTTWGAVGDADLSHYEIQLSTANDFSVNVLTRHHPGDGDRLERWEGLQGNVTYYARVRAVDWALNASAWVDANIASATDADAPNQVANLIVAGARSVIGLDWDDNTEADLSYYEIQRDDDAAGSPSGAWATIATARVSHYIDETFSEADIQAETVYHYRVRAVDTSGNAGNWSASDSDNLDPFGSDSIAALAIIAGKIAANAVDTNELNALAVTTAKLDTGAVTAEKMTVTVGGYNLLTNSGFNDDDDDDDVPDEWTEHNNITNHTNELDTSDKVVGTASYHIEVTAGDLDTHYNYIQQTVTLADVPLAVGDDFCLSGYLKTNGLSDLEVRIEVRWMDAVPNVLQTDVAVTETGDGGWGRYYVTNTVPAGAITARVRCIVELTANDGIGEAWFDAIKLERGDIPTAWTTGMIGHVTIDSNRVQVQDSNAKVWLGQRGSSLGMWGEDAAGNLEVGWYASGTNAGYIVAGGGDVLIGSDGITITSESSYLSRTSIEWVESGTVYGRLYNYNHDASNSNVTILGTRPVAGFDAYTNIFAETLTGLTASMELFANCAGNATGFQMFTNDGGTPVYINVKLDGTTIGGFTDDKLFIGEAADSASCADSTIGIVINQGANDDQVLAFKSSDVDHGCTTLAETDTFAYFKKCDPNAGGVQIAGLRDSGAANNGALILDGLLDEDVDTTKSTAGDAIVHIRGYQISGTATANVVSNGNVVAIKCRRGGSTVTLTLFDEDGDIHYDGSTNSYDDEDDALMAADLAHLMSGEYEKLIGYNHRILEQARIIGPADEHGRFMVSIKRVNALMLGALGQLWEKTQRYERALLTLGIEPALLERK